MANYLSRACNTWAKEAKLTNTVLINLQVILTSNQLILVICHKFSFQSYIGSEHNGSTWMLFSLITAHVPCKDPGMVMDYFNTSIVNPEGVGLYTLLQILKVLFASVSNLGEQDRIQLQSNLLSLVKKFKIPPELISISVDVITVVSGLQVDKEDLKRYQSSVDGWTVPILDTIDNHLKSVLLESPSGDAVDEDLLCRQIFTLGELAQISPHRITRRMYLLLQSIIFQSPSNMTTTTTTMTIPSTQTQASQPPSIVFVPSEKLQAVVVVSLGKMCLQNEEQAKKIIPAFGQILDSSQDPAMKNNIMYALTDMCVRYASLVDPLIPQMTTCLKDKFLSVRRTTLILLINLLQEDYLKIRGNGKFFFRILHTLLDPSQEIQHLTTFYIQQRMLKRLPKIMYSNFVESIFHFNDFKEHGSFNKFIVSDKEKVLFDLSGERKTEKRRTLYKFMLENMNDEQRFQTTYRLCQDVLGGVVEDSIKLTPASLPVLKDTFFVLASEAIKLASLKSKASDNDEPETDEDRANMVMNAAKKQIISGVVKKNVMENVIPIIIGLKHKLEAAKSPLISDLFQYLRKLMEDYKNEVTEILAEDKQLAKEIEFDLRRYEQEEQERREREQLRLVKSRTQSPSSRANSPASRANSPASRANSPASASKTSRPGSSSATPRTPGSVSRKERRNNLVRQALENVMSKTAQKENRQRKSVSDQDLSLGAKPLVDENEKDRSKSCPNVTTDNDSSKAKGSETEISQTGDVETENTSVNKTDKDSTLKSKEVEKEKSRLEEEEEQTEADSTLKNIVNEKDAEKEKPSEETVTTQDNDNNSQEKVDEVTPDAEEAATKKDDLDKSKRVSGQGMARPKTPKSKKFHNLRAISTPQVNKTVMGDNVTFMSESVMDLSAITVLSPASTISDPDSRRQTGTGVRSGNKDDTDAVSFRFKKGGKDLFDNLVAAEESETSSGASKTGELTFICEFLKFLKRLEFFF